MSWNFAKWITFIVWVVAGAANMAKIRGGFLTNYCADLFQPAWVYIVVREARRWHGRTPETAAILVLGGAVLTECSQYFWPHGLFRGRFDPMDILAYAVGVGTCYGVEKKGFSIQGRR
ncbi:MAG: hypothetical protein U0R19_30780 [Bryobacteraceae bacterium]